MNHYDDLPKEDQDKLASRIKIRLGEDTLVTVRNKDFAEPFMVTCMEEARCVLNSKEDIVDLIKLQEVFAAGGNRLHLITFTSCLEHLKVQTTSPYSWVLASNSGMGPDDSKDVGTEATRLDIGALVDFAHPDLVKQVVKD
jgi:hypothetical protein